MVFVFGLIYVMDYIYRFVYVELALHPRDEANLIMIRMVIIKKIRGQQMLGRMWRNRDTFILFVGVQINSSTVEDSVAIPKESRNRNTI